MVKRTKPAAVDGGSRQCIGSGQNQAAETKATPDRTRAVLPIDQIIVGDRTVGPLNPIHVDGSLLAGARRLAACKRRERPLRGQR